MKCFINHLSSNYKGFLIANFIMAFQILFKDITQYITTTQY